jgi:glycosyltransferase involved in cell wall biosynthesis
LTISTDSGRPLRFCMITTFYPPYNFGGDGIFVQRLSNALADRGHSVEVIHCTDAYRLGDRQPVGGYEDHPNVTVHGLRSRFGFLSPLATHQTGRPLFKSAQIKRILSKGFDVIHYHNISLVGGPKILQYGSGIKLYTMLEYWLVCPTNVLFKYNQAPCTRPSCFTCCLSYKRPPQLWRHSGLLSAAVKHVDAFIAPSRFSNEIHQTMGLNVPTVHIPYFIPTEPAQVISNNGSGEEPKAPYFLFVGRLEKLKGLHTLIPIFHKYPKALLLIAGSGSDESRLRKMAGGASNIQFLGRKSNPELQALYKRAVAVIVPSICYDASPLVTFEAFTQKTPVIVRNLGGMAQPIEESGGGFVYEKDEELIAAMDQLLNDPSYRNRLGAQGHKAFSEKWSVDAHLTSYFQLIHQIAAARRPPQTLSLPAEAAS